ncbi:AfsR/SARP family transcriptional regulator [Cryptosporangium arvum]|uniref:AfsR/SARP family transcriptional regulator n=1 Tax=Cryptosporangium arvum TaxID=80871 RepID=UPI0004BBBAC5|nr:BTAD domain-containing putative transcriptional regulator [Cryptosporangium arvum]
MQFSVLGPVRAWRGEDELDLGPAQQRSVLAALLLRAGSPVSLYEFIDVLWGAEAPGTAINIIHRYIGRLRRVFEPELSAREPGRWLARGAGGYRLDVSTDDVDLLQFRALRQRAAHLDAESAAEAAELLLSALELWGGPPGAGLPPQVAAHPLVTAVEGERLLAVKEAADRTAATADPVLAERLLLPLRQCAAEHPYDEDLQARLIRTLRAAGRQAEALEVYSAVRLELAEALGLDPGPELRAAQQAVLQPSAEPEVGEPEAPDAPMRTPAARPAQLPADVFGFTGRRAEIAALETLVDDGDGDDEPGFPIVTFGGMAGIGKTTLAVHVAHRLADRFPDGQLYVDLRGFHPGDSAVSPTEAVRLFLDALGVPAQRVPTDPDARIALYRSLLADRRMLVVLDNARDTDHVRSLLPGSAGSLTLVTSRNPLQGLVAREGARSTPLDLLSDDEAHEFVVRRLGSARIAGQPNVIAELVALCGGLPLALAIVCARAALHPTFPLSTVADELHESRDSLQAFAGEDPASDARAVFSWSYRALSPAAARLFRLLSVHPGPECSIAAAAALAGQCPADVRPVLAELAQVQLITERAPGRFSTHELLRVYATERAAKEDSTEQTAAAMRRLLDYYLHSAHAADQLLAPERDRVTLPAAPPDIRPEQFTEPRRAGNWLDVERTTLLSVIELDARDGDGRHSWPLASVLEIYLDRQGRWEDQLAVQTAALSAAQRLDDQNGLAHVHRSLGFVNGRLGQWSRADEHLRLSLALFEKVGDRNSQARVYRYQAFLANTRGQHREALSRYRHALTLYRATGRRSGEASTFNEIGYTHMLRGENRKALVECGRALKIHQEIHDCNGTAAAWDSLGSAHLNLREYDEALDCFAHALSIYREIHDRYLEADTLDHLGDTHAAAGSDAQAAGAWQAAIVILRALGHPDAEHVRVKLDEVTRRSSGQGRTLRWLPDGRSSA